jgi:hypothetical protein
MRSPIRSDRRTTRDAGTGDPEWDGEQKVMGAELRERVRNVPSSTTVHAMASFRLARHLNM